VTEKISPERPPMPCGWCGAKFVPKTGANRFCSDRCRYTHRDRARGHIPLKTEMTTTCDMCGLTFTYIKFRKPRKRCVPCAYALAHRERPDF
jgi:hypothetical protein